MFFPGLKQIIDDKRIKRYGVWDEDYQDYLKAESFVIDMREYTEEEFEDIHKTYVDLETLNLHKGPCEKYVLHAIVKDVGGVERIVSYFFLRENEFDVLFDNDREEKEHSNVFDKNEKYKENTVGYATLVRNRFIVLLATNFIEKNRYEASKNRIIENEEKAHKKGSGACTIIQIPGISSGGGGNVPPMFTMRPHFRRGHIRKFHPEDRTRWVWVSPCFIHAEPEIRRKAYLVRDAA
jgi:hypothetical protein